MSIGTILFVILLIAWIGGSLCFTSLADSFTCYLYLR